MSSVICQINTRKIGLVFEGSTQCDYRPCVRMQHFIWGGVYEVKVGPAREFHDRAGGGSGRGGLTPFPRYRAFATK